MSPLIDARITTPSFVGLFSMPEACMYFVHVLLYICELPRSMILSSSCCSVSYYYQLWSLHVNMSA